MLQRVVLPIEQLFKEKSHTVKPYRALGAPRRRALTRGRWKPLRTLEDRGQLICSDAWHEQLEPEARRAFDRDAREAWALYPGEVLLMLISEWSSFAACDYLSLVVEPTKQGFGSVVAAFEKAFQVERSCISFYLYLLGEWTRQAMGYVPRRQCHIFPKRKTLAMAATLGHWRTRLAAKVVDDLIGYYGEDGTPVRRPQRQHVVNWADSRPASWLLVAPAQGRRHDGGRRLRTSWTAGCDHGVALDTKLGGQVP